MLTKIPPSRVCSRKGEIFLLTETVHCNIRLRHGIIVVRIGPALSENVGHNRTGLHDAARYSFANGSLPAQRGNQARNE